MKLSNYAKVVILAAPLLLTACHSKKQMVNSATPQPTESLAQTEILTKVAENSQAPQFVSSKVKFSIEIGPQQVSLTGNLRIKRDDVIRLQLMAFGFVEAGRIEFTKDYVLIMDRINKMYMRAPYNYIDFLRNNGMNFYTLQALFYNELFKPGEKAISAKNMKGYQMVMSDEDAIISLEKDRMSYSWLANPTNGQIKIANIMYRDSYKGNTQLTWEYLGFKPLAQTHFPSDMKITLTAPNKQVKMDMKFNNLGTNSDWETRTTISNKYREVDAEEILRRIMAL
ncbi:DUF4292 domain-containing protein [Prevotella sp. E13-17]|uniref:DUF4292 domain-containing protein n=1 Tax=Prevotella sp. E13-17 TaxID=2913616 RepID=UPI001EDA4815|nr:DUF4292 domain-containing protein [Prevotella sp. E13-17]UKK51208.1 DUF4292 domain-containing protein [Prevotella sp. E13-17]